MDSENTTADHIGTDDKWHVTLPMNSSPVEFKRDTGAGITVMF